MKVKFSPHEIKKRAIDQIRLEDLPKKAPCRNCSQHISTHMSTLNVAKIPERAATILTSIADEGFAMQPYKTAD